MDPLLRLSATRLVDPVRRRGIASREPVVAVCDELERALRRAAEHLGSLGTRVQPPAADGLRHSLEIRIAMMAEQNRTPFAAYLGDGRPVRAGRELARRAVRRSPRRLPEIGLALPERLPALLPRRARRAIETGRALKADLEARLEGTCLETCAGGRVSCAA